MINAIIGLSVFIVIINIISIAISIKNRNKNNFKSSYELYDYKQASLEELVKGLRMIDSKKFVEQLALEIETNGLTSNGAKTILGAFFKVEV